MADTDGRASSAPLRRLALAALTAGAAACSAAPAPVGGISDRSCVMVRDIRDFDALDERHVIVETVGRRLYLFTLQSTCRGLRFARGISVGDGSARVCGDGFDVVRFDDATAGVARCRIMAIDRVDDRDAAIGLIEGRESR